jgi:WD40 repeat protein
LACGGDDTILLDGATGNTLRKLEFQVDAQGLAWSPDGQFLAAASRDKKLRIWRADMDKVVRTLEPTANPENALHVVAWSPDGNYLACGWSQGISLVEGGTGKVVRTIAEGLPWDTRMSLSWSPEGTTLAVGLGRRAEIAIVDRDSGERRQALPGSLQYTTNFGSPSAWSPDGSRIALVMEDDAKAYGVWDVASGKQSLPITVSTRCVHAAWSPDGATLAFSESPDGSIHLANTSTGKEIRSLLAPKPALVRQLAWSPDSKWLAAGGRDHLVQIWNTDTGQLVRELTGHHSSIVSLAWSPDGKLVAGGAEDDPFRIWDVRSGQALHELKRGCAESFACSAFSPDGKVLATADNCSIPSVCLWDVSSGQRIGTGNSKAPDIRALTWLPGGTCATFGEDGQLRFWGAAGYLVRTLKLGPTAGDYYLSSFSPGGDVVARGWLNSIWFHQATTGRCLGVWLRLTGDRYLTVAPEGSFYNSSHDEHDLFCVAQTEKGQETLTLDEFRAKYGWKNDSDHVRLITK